jgi:flavin-dependent dehydrogenase
MEIEHPHDWGRGPAHLRPEVAHLEYGAVPGGYAWVFPKADHLNIGAGVLMRRRGEAGDSGMSQHLRRVISRYPAALRIDDRSASCRVHAHPIPTWRGREPLNTPDGRVLLVGDAAGLVNPFFGDGILYAMHSGRIAADCLARGAPHEYTDCVHTQFAEKLDAALALARIFYRRPHFCYRFGVRLPEATRVAARVICGDAVITDVRRRVWHYIREALAGRRVAH